MTQCCLSTGNVSRVFPVTARPSCYKTSFCSAVAAMVAFGCAGCSSSSSSASFSATATSPAAARTSVPSRNPSSVSASTASSRHSGSPRAGRTPSLTSVTPQSSTAPAPTIASQMLTLRVGETAHLAYFDVTFLRTAPGRDGISHGWKVRVCYTASHPRQNADGTTRVSTNPWSVLVRDGEAHGSGSRWVRIEEFPQDGGWDPPYTDRLISLGQCAEGWLAIRHDNPDLQYLALRYAPADFGDRVTWETS